MEMKKFFKTKTWMLCSSIKNDIRNGLSNEGLKSLCLLSLGPMYDKCEKRSKIADYLGFFNKRLYRCFLKFKNLDYKSCMLSKADLMSEMVYEFIELQGLDGLLLKIAKRR